MASKVRAVTVKAPVGGNTRLILLDGMRKIAKDIVADFEKTTASWKHKPKFDVKVSLRGRTPTLEVSTMDEVYRWTDEGTSPHVIVPVKAKVLVFPSRFSPKTSPGVLGSGPGLVGGPNIYAHVVLHPGTQPRKFSEKITAKWRGEFGKRMKVVMKDVAEATGHARSK